MRCTEDEHLGSQMDKLNGANNANSAHSHSTIAKTTKKQDKD